MISGVLVIPPAGVTFLKQHKKYDRNLSPISSYSSTFSFLRYLGTNPNTATGDFTDSNTDSEGDGYTELERYLDFMAQPHVFLFPDASETINLASLFAGYTNQPTYAVEVVGTGITVECNGALLTIKSNGEDMIATLNMMVSDAEGSVFTRRLCVAVSSNETLPTSINPVQRSLSESVASQSTFNVQRYYNLMGQKVGRDYKGLVIANGKKIIIR